jgi:hypothetical protein
LGIDFLKAQADKYRKATSARYEAAAQDLLSKPSSKLGLKVAAQLTAGSEVTAGESVLLVAQKEAVYVCRENLALAEVKSPPAALRDQLGSHSGVLIAEIEELHRKAKAISVRIITNE